MDLEFTIEDDFSDYFWDAYLELVDFKGMTRQELKNMGYLNIEDL